jgi:ribosomal protein S27E
MKTSLVYRIAVLMAKEIETKVYESDKHTFEYDPDNCDPEISSVQEFYLKTAKKVIKRIKTYIRQQQLSGSTDATPKSCPKCKSKNTQYYEKPTKDIYCTDCGHDFT